MKISFLIIITLLHFSCAEDNSTNSGKRIYLESGKAALVLVVENSDRANQQIEDIAFNTYPAETLQIFSDIFSVTYDSLYGKDLNTILDQYGEPWQIERTINNTGDYYDRIVVLTDSTATKDNLVSELSQLSDENYNIDMVFSLHGSQTNIVFFDKSEPIAELTIQLEELDIPIRVLYQTNCKSADALSLWNRVGVAGCNGTIENNYLTIFAPSHFIYNWVNGKSYHESVQAAYDNEIEQLKSYNDILPILDYITQGNYLYGSLPILSGSDLTITIDDYIL
jgi:hypothetical protein